MGHSRDLASSRLSLARHILASPPISTVACMAPPDWGHRLHFNLNYLLELGLVRSFSNVTSRLILLEQTSDIKYLLNKTTKPRIKQKKTIVSTKLKEILSLDEDRKLSKIRGRSSQVGNIPRTHPQPLRLVPHLAHSVGSRLQPPLLHQTPRDRTGR